MPSQRCSRSARASAPSMSSMPLMPWAPVLVSMALAVLMWSSESVHAGGAGAQLRDAGAEPRRVAALRPEGEIPLQLARRRSVAVQGRQQQPAVPDVLAALGVEAQQHVHRP